MKIDEAKTPYHDPENPVSAAMLSETDLENRLQNITPKVMQDTDSDEDLSPQDKKKKVKFPKKKSV